MGSTQCLVLLLCPLFKYKSSTSPTPLLLLLLTLLSTNAILHTAQQPTLVVQVYDKHDLTPIPQLFCQLLNLNQTNTAEQARQRFESHVQHDSTQKFQSLNCTTNIAGSCIFQWKADEFNDSSASTIQSRLLVNTPDSTQYNPHWNVEELVLTLPTASLVKHINIAIQTRNISLYETETAKSLSESETKMKSLLRSALNQGFQSLHCFAPTSLSYNALIITSIAASTSLILITTVCRHVLKALIQTAKDLIERFTSRTTRQRVKVESGKFHTRLLASRRPSPPTHTHSRYVQSMSPLHTPAQRQQHNVWCEMFASFEELETAKWRRRAQKEANTYFIIGQTD